MCGRFNITDMPGRQGLLDDLGIDLKLPELQHMCTKVISGAHRSRETIRKFLYFSGV